MYGYRDFIRGSRDVYLNVLITEFRGLLQPRQRVGRVCYRDDCRSTVIKSVVR